MPNCSSSSLQTAPHATRATVSRALARSRMSRASWRSYLSEPARSAWPGRGGGSRRRPSAPRGAGPAGPTYAQRSPSLCFTTLSTEPPPTSHTNTRARLRAGLSRSLRAAPPLHAVERGSGEDASPSWRRRVGVDQRRQREPDHDQAPRRDAEQELAGRVLRHAERPDDRVADGVVAGVPPLRSLT